MLIMTYFLHFFPFKAILFHKLTSRYDLVDTHVLSSYGTNFTIIALMYCLELKASHFLDADADDLCQKVGFA